MGAAYNSLYSLLLLGDSRARLLYLTQDSSQKYAMKFVVQHNLHALQTIIVLGLTTTTATATAITITRYHQSRVSLRRLDSRLVLFFLPLSPLSCYLLEQWQHEAYA